MNYATICNEEGTFDDYQRRAYRTAIYPDSMDVIYPALGLAGEAGEVANKVKKFIRDKDGLSQLQLVPPKYLPEDLRHSIADELGDVLWYAAAVATDLGLSLGDIAERNLDKLQSRSERGTIGGSER